MAQWSDGRERSKSYFGTVLDLSIEKYFDDRNEEERLGLKWDNEAMRRDLEDLEPVKRAAAGA